MSRFCFLIGLLIGSQATANKRDGLDVASTYVGADEIIIALDQVEKFDRVAVSALADNQEYSSIGKAELKRRNLRVDANIESIVRFAPDVLIVASFNNYRFIEQISKVSSNKIKVLKIDRFNTVKDIQNSIAMIGKKVNRMNQANNLIKQMNQKLTKGRCQGRILRWVDGGATAGRDTLFTSLISTLGCTNAAETIKGWQKAHPEVVLSWKPDWIVISDENSISSIKSAPGWKGLDAVRANRFIVIPTKILDSTSHHLGNAAKYFSKTNGGNSL